MNTSLAELLSNRYQFEEIVSFRKTYDLPTYNSDIDSLYYFLNHGAKKNRFRKRFLEASDLAKKIIESYENENANLPSIYGQEVETV
jgi:hypothetical protein